MVRPLYVFDPVSISAAPGAFIARATAPPIVPEKVVELGGATLSVAGSALVIAPLPEKPVALTL
jgi:hypothetical protein